MGGSLVRSVVEDGEVEVAEAVGIGDCFDFDDFSVCDGEAEDHQGTVRSLRCRGDRPLAPLWATRLLAG